ncbi:class I SAM-dependent methyltransferase [Blastopirellula marina]|uniref:Class I SAM-dependent methyltransferase n=1 Tax=Blastopirellula marina TaxID=124 RepID=A0A2S8FHG2_9BACT|nr:class I SAM-dependent methyltransferase [Blastopirellula marina]PQO31606.1 hypothetical protein C5Y98_19515 [Blastopirellula marina]PTL42913.1 class I SAM-dependent methyltransferase [Blastopirellula marina]
MAHRVFHAWDGTAGEIGSEITAAAPCPISGDRAAVVVSNRDRRGYPLRTVISKTSGLVYVDPQPPEEAIDDFYRHSYRLFYKSSSVPKWKHTARNALIASQRVEKLNQFVPKGAAVLDIGTGSGELLYVGQKHGYQMQGLEVDQAYSQFGRNQYGVLIANTSLQAAELPPETFDAVTIFHVLEHLADPLGAMRKMTHTLKIGGHLILEVPNVESKDACFAQKWHLGHLYHFNCVTMAAMANRCGLVPLVLATCGGKNHTEAIFIKVAQPPPVDWESIVAGNFAQTWATLQYQARWGWRDNWYARLDRVWHKLSRNIRERLSAFSEPNRRRLVDKVVEERT